MIMTELTPIPEELPKQLLNKRFKIIDTVCPNCHKLVENVMMLSYAYNKENHNRVYIGKCAYCKKFIVKIL